MSQQQGRLRLSFNESVWPLPPNGHFTALSDLTQGLLTITNYTCSSAAFTHSVTDDCHWDACTSIAISKFYFTKYTKVDH